MLHFPLSTSWLHADLQKLMPPRNPLLSTELAKHISCEDPPDLTEQDGNPSFLPSEPPEKPVVAVMSNKW